MAAPPIGLPSDLTTGPCCNAAQIALLPAAIRAELRALLPPPALPAQPVAPALNPVSAPSLGATSAATAAVLPLLPLLVNAGSGSGGGEDVLSAQELNLLLLQVRVFSPPFSFLLAYPLSLILAVICRVPVDFFFA